MSERDDGGPAFPHDGCPEASNAHLGMTLRDYFAAHAPSLPAQVRSAFVQSLRGDGADLAEHAKVCARWACLYADAMLKERAK